jgi:adenylosuccinate lyase
MMRASYHSAISHHPHIMDFSLTALSPVDGRYRAATEGLAHLLSEAGLVRERIRIEAQWMLMLGEVLRDSPVATFSPTVSQRLELLAKDPGETSPVTVKNIEKRINHDVKAVEYFVRDEIRAAGATPAQLELVHIGCTSEDINNMSYARLLARARNEQLLPALDALLEVLAGFAATHANLPMLARTHGQTASPTTLGKEFANIQARLTRARRRLERVEILGKWNGAVGNFNAHVAAFPALDWISISQQFVERCGLAWNAHTTQIEPHDWIGEYCDAVAAINVIGIDMCRDIWGYISLGYLRQRAVEGEVGSSTMPHKINPIDFENAEGNLGVANALLRHFAEKLPVSRWQRDLTDSTVLRNLGVALGHSLIAWRAALRGLGKIAPNPTLLAADLADAWEVLGEAVQTVLRAEGVPNGYELLKEHTRGKPLTRDLLADLIRSLPLPEQRRVALLQLTPQTYLGLAERLSRLPIR